MRLGVGLKAVMEHAGFSTAVDILKQEYQSKVFDSNPSERERRELAYQEARALDSLLATMNSFIALAEHEALKHLVYPDDEDDEINF